MCPGSPGICLKGKAASGTVLRSRIRPLLGRTGSSTTCRTSGWAATRSGFISEARTIRAGPFALIGRRSYKNRDDPDRLIASKDLVDALEQGRAYGAPRLKLSHAMRESLVADASGDRLDVVLCLVQAAWAQAQPGYGLPAAVDPVEGWIIGAR